MAKSKYFRIAVEGQTVDGREIDGQWLRDMAESYDPNTYTARINCEHIAGYSPEKPFNAYGSVLSLKVEEVEINLDGKMQKRLALFAEIDANDQLIALNKAGQKLFTSCEIHTNFAGTGKAYLVGLAVTDSPASLGTEPLKFAAMARPNSFTTAHETAIELLAEAQPTDIGEAVKTGVIGALAALFGKSDSKTNPPVQPVTPPAPANDNSFDVDAFAVAIGGQVAAAIKPTADGLASLQTDFAAFKSQMENTEQRGFSRAPATGGSGDNVTDC